MFKYMIAAIALVTPSAASAQSVSVNINRFEIIVEASKTICRIGMNAKDAGKSVDQNSAYLKLNTDERLLMLSLCVLYAQGRVDGF